MILTNTNTKQRGFTIVELLIVIVVIAILAAISMVAYTGIQNRARTTQYRSDATSITKVADVINSNEDGSGYPTTAADFASMGGDTAKLPNNVTLKDATAKPSVETAKADAEVNPRVYSIRSCSTDEGLVVYYYNAEKKEVNQVSAGSCQFAD